MSDLSDYEQELIANVDKHGWQATYVFDPDGNDPTFMYSIGFPKTLNCPDFIIFGLSNELMHAMLWQIFRQIKAGKKPEDGADWEDLLGGGFICRSRNVHPDYKDSNYFNSARWFHAWQGGDADQMQFIQMFWPDAKDNRFPWDDRCADDLKIAQPLLYESGQNVD